MRLEVCRCNGFFIICVTYDDFSESFLKVGKRICKTQNRHNFGSNRDVVTVFTGNAVYSAAETVRYKTKLTVIHIHTSLPYYSSGVDIKGISLIDMVIKHSGKKIVCRADSVEVTGKVEVDVLHRNNLCIATACSTTLDTENGAERRLAECYKNILADFSHTVGKTDCCCSLSLTCGGGVYCCYKNEFSILIFFIVKD